MAFLTARSWCTRTRRKPNARQTNKNLLLSESAVVDTKPQLEIYADDVKCSHGSTIGQMDADAIFYFRSRGLGRGRGTQFIELRLRQRRGGRLGIENLRRRLDEYLVGRFGAG